MDDLRVERARLNGEIKVAQEAKKAAESAAGALDEQAKANNEKAAGLRAQISETKQAQDKAIQDGQDARDAAQAA